MGESVREIWEWERDIESRGWGERESIGWEREIESRGWGKERVGSGRWCGRGKVRERRMGFFV